MENQTQQFLQQEAQRAAEELGVKTDDTPTTSTQTEAPQPVQEPPAQEPVQVEEQPPAQVETPVQPVTPEPTVPVQSPEVEEEDDYVYPTLAPNQFQQPPQQYVQQPEQQPVQQYQQPVPSPQQQQPQQVPQLDPSQFTDQYGNVDMARFTQAIRTRDEALVNQVTQNLTQRYTGDFQTLAQTLTAQARQEASNQIMVAEAEKRAWERTFTKYPQVRENKELRDQIHKMRLGEVAVTGKPVSPQKMADRYFSQIRQAREDGVRQAVETTKVQASAHLETANNTASEKGLKAQADWSKVDSRDRRQATGARVDIIKQMLADGKL